MPDSPHNSVDRAQEKVLDVLALTDPGKRPRSARLADISRLAALFQRCCQESDPAVLRELLRSLVSEDADGEIPLDHYLESAEGSGWLGTVNKLFGCVRKSPSLFALTFQGVEGSQRRALAAALFALATEHPAEVEAIFRKNLTSPKTELRHLAVLSLLELPHPMVQSILAGVDDSSLGAVDSDAIAELEAALEMRNLFAESSLNYFPIRRLGKGGGAEVYLCRDLSGNPDWRR